MESRKYVVAKARSHEEINTIAIYLQKMTYCSWQVRHKIYYRDRNMMVSDRYQQYDISRTFYEITLVQNKNKNAVYVFHT